MLTDVLLTKLLAMELGPSFDRALLKHGPIQPSEVPVLSTLARGNDAVARRNATYLLRLARTEARFEVLAELAKNTTDANVFALAASQLAPPASASIARQREALLQQGLQASEPHVRAAATIVAMRVKFDVDAARSGLRDPARDVRDATIEAIADNGVGVLEPDLRALFDDRALRTTVSLAGLLRALLTGDDPTLATALAMLLDDDPLATAMVANAIAHVRERKPWLREFLAQQVEMGGPYRWHALLQLSHDPQASLQPLVEACRRHLADRARRGDTSSDTGVNACATFLGTRFDRTFQGEATILAFAAQWLDEN